MCLRRRARFKTASLVVSAFLIGTAVRNSTLGETKPLDAHAWLDAAGVEVTGYPVPGRFAEIACFV
jgi:hypothetical protein